MCKTSPRILGIGLDYGMKQAGPLGHKQVSQPNLHVYRWVFYIRSRSCFFLLKHEGEICSRFVSVVCSMVQAANASKPRRELETVVDGKCKGSS